MTRNSSIFAPICDFCGAKKYFLMFIFFVFVVYKCQKCIRFFWGEMEGVCEELNYCLRGLWMCAIWILIWWKTHTPYGLIGGSAVCLAPIYIGPDKWVCFMLLTKGIVML